MTEKSGPPVPVATVLDTMAEPLYVVDRRRRILLWNQAAEALTGYAAADVVGRKCRDGLLNHVDADGTPLCATGCPLRTVFTGEDHAEERRMFLHHRDGYRRPVFVQATVLRDGDGAVIGATEVFRDDSEMRRIRERLVDVETRALTDELTQLPNRRAFEGEVRRWLGDRDRHGHGFGLLVIDIDHFKRFNDTHGHQVGDQVLCTVAKTLAYSARAGDVAARWGGEEFVVLCRTDGGDEDLMQAGERLRALVAASVLSGPAGRLSVTVSIGAAHAIDGLDADALFARADAALYEAKAAGRDRVVSA